MKKILLFIVIILSVIALSNITIAQTYCNKAVIGPTNDPTDPYEIICGDPADTGGFCPENYGDWSSCTPNAFGARCNPIDLDCTNNGALNLECTDVNQNLPIPLTATATGGVSGGNLNLINPLNGLPFATTSCTTSPCTLTDSSRISPSGGGKSYTYTSQFNNYGQSETASATCYTFPIVSIILKKVTGQGQIGAAFGISPIKDEVAFETTASSDQGLSQINLYLEKKNTAEVFEAINPIDCTFCFSAGCNLLGTISYSSPYPLTATYTPIWDSTVCDNKDFKIIAQAFDRDPRTSAQRTAPGENQVEFKLQNSRPVVVPEPSRLLKLISVKIKTWLLT